jgi:predicted secreted protein
VALPIGIRTQEEDGSVVPGTPASAPAHHMLGRKLFWTTVIATVLWAVICGVILWGGISVRDLDIWGRM